ncbi:MAG: hypoxanthine phosphoribosyltransferase [Gallionellaceae bacterium]|nr:MAG: hypoxanthine phosphoribosyltransferase [Gallionellaceae bacterium]
MLTNQQARDTLADAEMLFSADEVQAALVHVAKEINATLADQHPLVLSVMGGAVIFTGQLLPMLDFPLDFDYLHVSRYGNEKQGGELHWRVAPRENVKGKVVLVLDDILDEGHTMHAIKQRVMELGATKFYCAVFADKENGKAKPIQADFVGMGLPDRFVFGYGMDIHGAWRNLPAIYAVKED